MRRYPSQKRPFLRDASGLSFETSLMVPASPDDRYRPRLLCMFCAITGNAALAHDGMNRDKYFVF